MEIKITQEEFNTFLKEIRSDVDELITESGLSKAEWVLQTEDARGILFEWEHIKDVYRNNSDIIVPDLIEGIAVTNKGQQGQGHGT